MGACKLPFLQLCYCGGPQAWRAVRDAYNAGLARRALRDLGRHQLINGLEQAGAL
jgi:hypothetical protein